MSGAPRKRPQLSRRARMIWMGIATAACLALVPFAAVGALFSPLVFDHQGNILNPLAWMAFLMMVLFWIVCLIGPFGAWVLFKRGEEPLAWAAMAAPLAWLTVLAAILQFIPG